MPGFPDSSWPMLAIASIAAIGAAGLFRWSGGPGWRLVGGLLVAVLLGPTVAGRLAPHAWERQVLGGVEERTERDRRRSEHAAWRAAAAAAGVDLGDPEVQRDDARRRAAIDEATAAWRHAVHEHQRPRRLLIGIAAIAVAVAAGIRGAPSSSTPSGVAGAVTIGLWAGCLPALALLVTRWWRSEPLLDAAALAAIAAVAVGPWVLDRRDRGIARTAERGGLRLVVLAGLAASTTAAIAFGAAAFRADIPVWIGLSVALLGGAIWRLRDAPSRRGHGRLLGVVERVLLPALAALAALTLDWQQSFSIWLCLAVVVISSDLRWLGGLLGAVLPGGRRITTAGVLALSGCAAAPLQLAIAGAAAAAGIVTDQWLAALLLGAVATDATGGLRRRVAALSWPGSEAPTRTPWDSSAD